MKFLLCLVTAWLGVTLACCHAHAADEQRPNIVLILADDLNWNDIGCYGNRQIKTPNIDRLATQGMRLTHCFTATAMCAPTRQQLYTGVFPVRNGAYPNHSQVKSGTRSIAHHFKPLGYRVGLIGKKHFGPAKAFPFQNVKDARAFIQADGPFFLVVASKNPHAPWPQPKNYNAAKLTLSPNLVDTPETRTALASYYTEVSQLDDEVGHYMKRVDEAKVANNTIFIFTSEQGSGFPFAKWTCYELGLRTALVVRWPDHIKPRSTSSAMVQYVDILPTLLKAAGGNPAKADTGLAGGPQGKQGFDGREFTKVLYGQTEKHRDAVFGVHTTRGIIAGSDYPIRSIRDERYKLILNLNHQGKFSNIVQAQDRANYWKSWLAKAKSDAKVAQHVAKYSKRPAVEFYDLQADPHEQQNLADAAEHSERIAKMRQTLAAWMKSQGDDGLQTELAVGKRKHSPGKKKSHHKAKAAGA